LELAGVLTVAGKAHPFRAGQGSYSYFQSAWQYSTTIDGCMMTIGAYRLQGNYIAQFSASEQETDARCADLATPMLTRAAR
jgi:hypothetical protein